VTRHPSTLARAAAALLLATPPAASAQRPAARAAAAAAPAAGGTACAWQARQRPSAPAAAAAAPVALKDVFRGAFLVGTALNVDQFYGRDAGAVALVKRHFDVVSPEDVLKWECVHPRPGVYDFAAPDRYVEFGRRNGIAVIGHTLVWHSQVPRWVFEDAAGRPVGRDTLLARMREHIFAVAGRYRGRIKGWDVVNEALNEDGTLRDSPWRRASATTTSPWRSATRARPTRARSSTTTTTRSPTRRSATARCASSGRCRRRASRSPASAPRTTTSSTTVGGRRGLDDPRVRGARASRCTSPSSTSTCSARAAPARAPTCRPRALRAGQTRTPPGSPTRAAALARRYGELFAVYLSHRDVVDRVTFWGVRDGDSWLNTGRCAGAPATRSCSIAGGTEAGLRGRGAHGASGHQQLTGPCGSAPCCASIRPLPRAARSWRRSPAGRGLRGGAESPTAPPVTTPPVTPPTTTPP
jgi:endo-1,4-beta-xylanase